MSPGLDGRLLGRGGGEHLLQISGDGGAREVLWDESSGEGDAEELVVGATADDNAEGLRRSDQER